MCAALNAGGGEGEFCLLEEPKEQEAMRCVLLSRSCGGWALFAGGVGRAGRDALFATIEKLCESGFLEPFAVSKCLLWQFSRYVPPPCPL